MQRIVILGFFTGLLILCILKVSFSQEKPTPLSGTYTMKTEEVELTLVLEEHVGSKISGSIKSTTGVNLELEGQVEENIATGLCTDDYGSVFFEIYKENDDLILSLIEPNQSNTPDYTTATYLSFTKKPESDNTNSATSMNSSSNQSSSINQNTSGNAVGDPTWGFTFIPPPGWSYQKSGEGIILGHTSIAGIIFIFAHILSNIPEIQQEMHKGIQDGANYLNLEGELSTLTDNILAGEFQGAMDGQQAKARGFGTLSPHGGGAFILAISTPEMLGDDIIRDAEVIAKNLVYKKSDVTDLMRHFSGKWANFTTNTANWIQFNADGTYGEQYESSYSGDFDNDAGNWGAAGSSNSQGRWTAQGNQDKGHIVVRLANGNEMVYEYVVHQENGQKYYAEYWFNGKLYAKSTD